MPDPSSWLRKDSDTLAPLRVLLVLSILGPALLLAMVAWYSCRVEFHDAEQNLTRLTEVAREHAQKVFDTHRLIADRVDDAIHNMDNASILQSEAALHRKLSDMIAGLPQVKSVVIIDRNGSPLASADVYPLGKDVSLADRDYFLALQRGPDRTYVSRLHQRRLSSGTFFGLAYRREAPNGSFAGVIDVLVTPEFFASFYRTLIGEGEAVQQGMTLALMRADGTTLALYPTARANAAQLPSSHAFFAAITHSPDGGSYLGRSVGDSAEPEQHYAYRRVPGHALYVVAGTTTEGVVGAWLREFAGYLAFGLMAMMALFGITLSALRRTRREQAALTHAREEMQRREAAEDALHQMQKLEAVGQLTAGVAHDFNNLLTVISGNLEFMGQAHEDPLRTARRIEQMRAATTRGARLTAQLLTFSRRQRLSPQPLDLNAVLSSMQEMLRSTLGGTVRVETALAPQLWPAMADRTQLELAILNLAINGRDAMASGGTLTLETANIILPAPTRAEEPPAGDYLAISITDTGSGMPQEVLSRAFEPFFTTKPIGEGSGLGLSQVYGFAQQSGGGIKLRSATGIGTCVTLYLPRALASGPQMPTMVATTANQGHGIILLVDDDADVRSVTGAMLARFGYTILQAEGGTSALREIGSEPAIQLAVIDYAMPEMNGIELARRLRALRPNLPVLFITGHADANALAPRESGDLLLQKPFTASELVARVTALMGVAQA